MAGQGHIITFITFSQDFSFSAGKISSLLLYEKINLTVYLFSILFCFRDASPRNEQHPLENSEQLIERQKRKEAAFMKLRMELERAHLVIFSCLIP